MGRKDPNKKAYIPPYSSIRRGRSRGGTFLANCGEFLRIGGGCAGRSELSDILVGGISVLGEYGGISVLGRSGAIGAVVRGRGRGSGRSGRLGCLGADRVAFP